MTLDAHMVTYLLGTCLGTELLGSRAYRYLDNAKKFCKVVLPIDISSNYSV